LVLGPEDGYVLAVALDLPARFVLRHAAELEIKMTPAMVAMLN